MSHNMALHLIIIHFQNPELSSTTNIFGDYAGNITSIFICLSFLPLLLFCAFCFHPLSSAIAQHCTSPVFHLLAGKREKHLQEADSRGTAESGSEGWLDEQTNVWVLIFWLNAEERSSDSIIMRNHCRLQNKDDRQLWKMMHLTRGSVCVCVVVVVFPSFCVSADTWVLSMCLPYFAFIIHLKTDVTEWWTTFISVRNTNSLSLVGPWDKQVGFFFLFRFLFFVFLPRLLFYFSAI